MFAKASCAGCATLLVVCDHSGHEINISTSPHHLTTSNDDNLQPAVQHRALEAHGVMDPHGHVMTMTLVQVVQHWLGTVPILARNCIISRNCTRTGSEGWSRWIRSKCSKPTGRRLWPPVSYQGTLPGQAVKGGPGGSDRSVPRLPEGVCGHQSPEICRH